MNWDDIIVDAAATDTGMRRANNQDSYKIVRASRPETWRQRGHVFVVADGMGAHAVGEMASKLACDNIPHNYVKAKSCTPTEAITKAYKEVASLINGKATANKEFEGMGTTTSTLILLPEGALIAHVGDSRIYRVRNGRIDQLTFDHSLAWELVKRNHLTKEQALKAVPRNVITRSLGPDPNVEVDIEGPYPLEPGDVFLLCSDGLSGPIEDHELGAFAANFHPKDACRYLLQLANLRGGHDNITVLIARIGPWSEPESEEQVPEVAVAHVENGRRGGWMKGIASGLLGNKRRAGSASAVEEHLYRSEECPINEELVDRLAEQVRVTQQAAIEQTWPVEWTRLAGLRRRAEKLRNEGKLREALKELGESIELLGLAGRTHRKAAG
ncbi:PP2C family protein-serine/threonine phosphatase [Tundrisphaera lichenicola]|uniref:PP2C family protein-serine/threonine phosphatase n=1 Tax=Tundrisphaera lichenicola TaxID=2029860 RepID=UPI003EC081D3